MTSSSLSRSSTPWRVVTRLIRSLPTLGATSATASTMMRWRIALLRAASLPPCKARLQMLGEMTALGLNRLSI